MTATSRGFCVQANVAYGVQRGAGEGVPLAMVHSGGYGLASWQPHARSIEGILARFDCCT